MSCIDDYEKDNEKNIEYVDYDKILNPQPSILGDE
jgi:hypothetical protein